MSMPGALQSRMTLPIDDRRRPEQIEHANRSDGLTLIHPALVLYPSLLENSS